MQLEEWSENIILYKWIFEVRINWLCPPSSLTQTSQEQRLYSLFSHHTDISLYNASSHYKLISKLMKATGAKKTKKGSLVLFHSYPSTHLHGHTCTHIYIHNCMHAHLHIYTSTCVYYIHTYVHEHTFAAALTVTKINLKLIHKSTYWNFGPGIPCLHFLCFLQL